MQKVAIIGSGISGLACAHFLKSGFEVTVFEKNNLAGGHACTVSVDEGGREIFIDAGFMLFNHSSYPTFNRLLNSIGAVALKAPTTFSVTHQPGGISYSGAEVRWVFSEWRNIFRFRQIRLIREIQRFGGLVRKENIAGLSGKTLAEYCADQKLSDDFLIRYLIPVFSALSHLPAQLCHDVPAAWALSLLSIHGFPALGKSFQWYTINQGTAQYVNRLSSGLHLLKATEVRSVATEDGKIRVNTSAGDQFFEKVIFACPADEALRLLAQPDEKQKTLLGAVKYVQGVSVVHTDASVMPANPRLWSSVNCTIAEGPDALKGGTHFNMRILQKVSKKNNYFVSVNPDTTIDPSKVLATREFRHLVFDEAAIAVRPSLRELNNSDMLYFCGSYFGWGTHEDALRSAIAVSEQISGKKVRLTGV